MKEPIKHRPFSDLDIFGLHDDLSWGIHTKFDELFNNVVDTFFGDRSISNSVKATGHYPKIDASTEGDKWIVRAAIPGVNPDNVKVEIVQTEETIKESKTVSGIPLHEKKLANILKISGNMAEEYKSPENARFVVRELRKGTFLRQITLPDNIEGDPIAETKNGILSLTWKLKTEALPKTKTKTIAIKKLD